MTVVNEKRVSLGTSIKMLQKLYFIDSNFSKPESQLILL